MPDTTIGATPDTTDREPMQTRFPARILRSGPEPDRLDRALHDNPGIDADNAFFFSAEISSTRLDSYSTRMAPTTLQNFARQAREGRALLDSHNASKLGMGYSFDGRVEPVGDEMRAVADFYTVTGIEFGGQHSYRSTDDFVKALLAGLARDVSVGFYGGVWTCDICGNNWSDYAACPHFPGIEYAINEQQRQICTVTIDGAHLSEVSAVYDGATPGAMILKAERMADAGKLTPQKARVLERHFQGLHLPAVRNVWPGARTNGTAETPLVIGTDNPSYPALSDTRPYNEAFARRVLEIIEEQLMSKDNRELENQTDDELATPAEDAIESVPAVATDDPAAEGAGDDTTDEVESMTDQELREALAAAGVEVDGATTIVDAVTAVADRAQRQRQDLDAIRTALPADAPEGAALAEAVRWVVGEIERLRPLADDGRRYRADLVQEALAEGVRALGDGFSRETYEAVLKGATLDTIRQMRDDWKRIGDQRFPGGRHIDEDALADSAQESPEAVAEELPRRAFAA